VTPNEYRPVPCGGNVHTLWGTVLRRAPAVPTTLEQWATPDGDVVDVERLGRRDGPCVVVLHGLEGSTRAPYVRGLLHEVDRRGWNGVAVNFRSCGPTPNRRVQTYHSGYTQDLTFVLERLEAEGLTSIGVVGFSLGGNVLVKFMAECGEAAPLAAAVAVSVPFDLAACVSVLDEGGAWPRLYRSTFLRSLKRKALSWASRFPGTLDAARISTIRFFREFDEHVTARLFGFASAQDYWTCSSSGPLVRCVRKPTLLLSAADDPLFPGASIPTEAITGNPMTELALVRQGGHVGFVGGAPLSPYFAAEQIATTFLAGHLERRESAPAELAPRKMQ
jgi:predicted alpha/beta-fold hydrolase